MEISKYDEDLERVRFRQKRFDFVTKTLQEFDNLEPSSLDIIFEHKMNEIKESHEDMENNKQDRRDQMTKY